MNKIIILLATTLVVVYAAEIIPARDSFDVVRSVGFWHHQQLQAIYEAEQARLKYGTNLGSIAEYMRSRCDAVFGYDFTCVAAVNKPNMSFWYRDMYILLKSDTSDQIHIACLKMVRGNQLVPKL